MSDNLFSVFDPDWDDTDAVNAMLTRQHTRGRQQGIKALGDENKPSQPPSASATPPAAPTPPPNPTEPPENNNGDGPEEPPPTPEIPDQLEETPSTGLVEINSENYPDTHEGLARAINALTQDVFSLGGHHAQQTDLSQWAYDLTVPETVLHMVAAARLALLKFHQGDYRTTYRQLNILAGAFHGNANDVADYIEQHVMGPVRRLMRRKDIDPRGTFNIFEQNADPRSIAEHLLQIANAQDMEDQYTDGMEGLYDHDALLSDFLVHARSARDQMDAEGVAEPVVNNYENMLDALTHFNQHGTYPTVSEEAKIRKVLGRWGTIDRVVPFLDAIYVRLHTPQPEGQDFDEALRDVLQEELGAWRPKVDLDHPENDAIKIFTHRRFLTTSPNTKRIFYRIHPFDPSR